MNETSNTIPATAGNTSATLLSAPSAPAENYGASDMWGKGDFISHTVIIILLFMSIASWTKIVVKSWRAYSRKKSANVVESFWDKTTIDDAVASLDKDSGNESFAALAHQAVNAAAHFDEHANNTLGASLERGEFITRAMRQSIMRSTAKLETGLTMLASIGSVAPFVGLFGTVWGIYHALMGLSTTGQATIDKVSGPVGEALIMTAAGLFVAIPAVLAYNAFVRLNRIELTELDGFAHDLHSFLDTGVRMNSSKPRSSSKDKKAQLQLVEKGNN